jgi:hypothetical protein
MKRIWKWIRDDVNRDMVRMGAAAFAAIVAGTWAVLTFAVDHHPPSTTSVSASNGSVAAGHDVTNATIRSSETYPESAKKR